MNQQQQVAVVLLALIAVVVVTALTAIEVLVYRPRRRSRAKAQQLAAEEEERLEAEFQSLVSSTIREAIESDGESLSELMDGAARSSINIGKNESVFWFGDVSIGRVNVRTVSVAHHGVSTRVRVMKGVYLHSGELRRRRETSTEFEILATGTAVVTSRRIMFVSRDPSVPNWSKTWASVVGWEVVAEDSAVRVEPTTGKATFLIPLDDTVIASPRVLAVAMDIASGN